MKATIVGLQQAELASYIREKYTDIQFVQENAEVVLCYGGDGTLLYAERLHPGIPKVLIRNSAVCKLCPALDRDDIVQRVLKNEYSIQEYPKLIATVHGKQISALNDIIIGHARVNGVLRMTVDIQGKAYSDHEILGDGIIVSTPLGSTAYFHTITRTHFDSGIGIAFNNPIQPLDHTVIDANAVITVRITRGPGVVAADNDEQDIRVDTGDTITIQQDTTVSRIVVFE